MACNFIHCCPVYILKQQNNKRTHAFKKHDKGSDTTRSVPPSVSRSPFPSTLLHVFRGRPSPCTSALLEGIHNKCKRQRGITYLALVAHPNGCYTTPLDHPRLYCPLQQKNLLE